MNELLCSEGGGATRGSEFRLQAGQDRVNAELQTDPAFVRLPVARGYETLVDPDIADLLAGRRLHLLTGYAATSARGRSVRVHQLVMGRPLAGEIDHINRDRLDNRRCNLRIVPHRVNMVNVERALLPRDRRSGARLSARFTPLRLLGVRMKSRSRINVFGDLICPACAAQLITPPGRCLHSGSARCPLCDAPFHVAPATARAANRRAEALGARMAMEVLVHDQRA